MCLYIYIFMYIYIYIHNQLLGRLHAGFVRTHTHKHTLRYIHKHKLAFAHTQIREKSHALLRLGFNDGFWNMNKFNMYVCIHITHADQKTGKE